MAFRVKVCWQSTEFPQLMFFLLYKISLILLNFPLVLCSEFIAAVLISLHCGLGGDINIVWYHTNLLCGGDV